MYCGEKGQDLAGGGAEGKSISAAFWLDVYFLTCCSGLLSSFLESSLLEWRLWCKWLEIWWEESLGIPLIWRFLGECGEYDKYLLMRLGRKTVCMDGSLNPWYDTRMWRLLVGHTWDLNKSWGFANESRGKREFEFDAWLCAEHIHELAGFILQQLKTKCGKAK